MAFPPEIPQRPCTLGGATALESGELLVLVAEITASRGLKWGATGWQYPSKGKTVTGTPGAELSFSLVPTDLTGWRLIDDSGAIIDVSAPGSYSHTYTIRLTTRTPAGDQVGPARTIGPFPLPTGDLSPVDLDTMLPVGTVAGGAVLVPDSWGPLVVAAEAAAEAAAEDAAAALAEVRSRGPLTIPLGDSIDLGSDFEGHYSAGSIYNALTIQSGQRMQWLYNAGVGGNNTTQALARIDTDVIARNPGVCIIGGGVTNDHGSGIAPAVTRANLAAMAARLRAAGITPVLRLCTPVDLAGAGEFNTVALRRAAVQRHNAWARAWGPANGIPILDYYSPLVDETTGGFLTEVSRDGLHPNPEISAMVADAIIADGLPPCFNGVPMLTSALGDASDMLGGDGLFLGAPSGGVAAGWLHYGSSSATRAIQAGVGIPGNWQTITGGTTGNYVLYKYLITTGFAVGDVLQFSARVQKSDAGPSHVRLRFSSLPGEWDAFDLGAVNLACEPRALNGITAGRAPVPAGCVRLGVEVVADAPVTIKVAQVTLTNLTAIGIA